MTEWADRGGRVGIDRGGSTSESLVNLMSTRGASDFGDLMTCLMMGRNDDSVISGTADGQNGWWWTRVKRLSLHVPCAA